ncbi:hypothetical protein RZS08_04020, partial [Arthrospira platensis SPKY1]|nr:hypothetical protein [Arthrospira platensis SPKY1]
MPGPVHLNAPVRKPLEPAEAADGEERRFEALVDDLLNTGPPRIFPPPVGAPAEGVREVAEIGR